MPRTRQSSGSQRRRRATFNNALSSISVAIALLSLILSFYAVNQTRSSLSNQFDTKVKAKCNYEYTGDSSAENINLSDTDGVISLRAPFRCSISNLSGKNITVGSIRGDFEQIDKGKVRSLNVGVNIAALTDSETNSNLDISAFGDTNLTVQPGEQRNVDFSASFPITSNYSLYFDCDTILFADSSGTCTQTDTSAEVWEKLIGKSYGTLNGIEDTYLSFNFQTIDDKTFTAQACLPNQTCL